jgi:hypothetical protein
MQKNVMKSSWNFMMMVDLGYLKKWTIVLHVAIGLIVTKLFFHHFAQMTLLVTRFHKGVCILILLCVFIGWLVKCSKAKNMPNWLQLVLPFFQRNCL